MRILSEQANSKLRIAPGDWANLPEAEQIKFIEELRGARGKIVAKKAAKATDPNAPAKSPRAKATQSTSDFDDII